MLSSRLLNSLINACGFATRRDPLCSPDTVYRRLPLDLGDIMVPFSFSRSRSRRVRLSAEDCSRDGFPLLADLLMMDFRSVDLDFRCFVGVPSSEDEADP
jgi:hypothetical protein